MGSNKYTTQLLPLLEYSDEFTPIPFSGKFPAAYIASAHLFAIATNKELKKDQHHICNTDGIPHSQQLIVFCQIYTLPGNFPMSCMSNTRTPTTRNSFPNFVSCADYSASSNKLCTPC